MARTKRQSKKYAGKPKKATAKRNRKMATVGTVKRLISRNNEKKEFVYSALGISFSLATPTSYNLNYHGVTRGTGESAFLGNGYKIKSIEVNFQLSNYCAFAGVSRTAVVPVTFLCYIIKTKVFKTSTSLALQEMFDENIGLLNTTASLFKDNDKMKILKSRKVTINPDPSSTRAATRSKTVSLRAYPNTTFRYRDFDSSYEGNTYNYYAVVIPMDYPGDGNIVSYKGDIYTRVNFEDS